MPATDSRTSQISRFTNQFEHRFRGCICHRATNADTHEPGFGDFDTSRSSCFPLRGHPNLGNLSPWRLFMSMFSFLPAPADLVHTSAVHTRRSTAGSLETHFDGQRLFHCRNLVGPRMYSLTPCARSDEAVSTVQPSVLLKLAAVTANTAIGRTDHSSAVNPISSNGLSNDPTIPTQYTGGYGCNLPCNRIGNRRPDIELVGRRLGHRQQNRISRMRLNTDRVYRPATDLLPCTALVDTVERRTKNVPLGGCFPARFTISPPPHLAS